MVHRFQMGIFTATSQQLHQNDSVVEPNPTLFPTTEKRKRVRFDESRNQSYANQERGAEDCHETWYSKQEYNQLRSNTAKAVEALRKRNNQMQNDQQEMPIRDIIEALLDLVASVNHIVEDASSIMNAEIEPLLSQLYRVRDDNDDEYSSLDLIGIEMYLENRVRREAKERREAIQDVVYDVQKEYRSGLLDRNGIDDELRESCLYFSQASSLFAQIQAQARLVALTG